MSLTEKQIEEYRKKLRDDEYMEMAIESVAKKLSTGDAMVISYAEPETNNTEGKEMAKDSLYDLNNHLFERIEWLMDRDIKGEELAEEIKRTEAVVKVSAQIVNNANLLLKAKALADNANGKMKLPAMVEDKTR
jgi:translation initiation factor IF-2